MHIKSLLILKMLISVTTMVVVTLMTNTSTVAQSSNNYVIENRKFIKFFNRYVLENQMNGPARGVPKINIEEIGKKSYVITLSMLSLLSEVKKDLPDNIATIDERLVLIYFASSKKESGTKYLFNDIANLTVKDLCNDLIDTKYSNNVYLIPCSFKFDPKIIKLFLTKNRITQVHEVYE
jgi:hypothetical protein